MSKPCLSCTQTSLAAQSQDQCIEMSVILDSLKKEMDHFIVPWLWWLLVTDVSCQNVFWSVQIFCCLTSWVVQIAPTDEELKKLIAFAQAPERSVSDLSSPEQFLHVIGQVGPCLL